MTLIDSKHLHHFFLNKDINELYVSVAIMSFATSLIAVFVPIYLYQLGYSLESIIFYYIIVSAFFLLFSFPAAKVVSKLGVKHSMLLSMPFLIAYYIGLMFIGQQPILFYLLPIVYPMHTVLYNYGYHLNFIEHSDKAVYGREIAFLRICSNVMSFIAPLIGAMIIVLFNFNVVYLVGSALLLVSTLPLFLTTEVFEEIDFSIKSLARFVFSRKNVYLNLSFVGYAVESIINRIIWPVFLVLVMGSIAMVGGIISLTLFVSLIFIYYIGNLTDKRDKGLIISIGTVLHAVGWFGRLFVGSPLSIFTVDTYKNMAQTTLQLPWSALSYELAKRENYFEFIVAREIVFNLARVAILPMLVFLIYYIGFGFQTCFVVAAVFSLMYILIKRA